MGSPRRRPDSCAAIPRFPTPWLAARHAPRLVDRVVARQVRRRVASGAFDGAEIAAGLRERHGRGAG